ncbi:glycosyltransferase family A protein [Poseidonocella sedimentorum]|uniref:Glycosyl transferase family 2 n=1 Tax=Poseidonocella sedimentorum TaxID=871652 RepID=A0A1I6DFV7_9RHOB|nr:glycosyltransferase family A protein [Poseidonocella sedimentorum]SFR04258.1 hypothetical protein SAMN04515673_103144 [Poseidonocella sedimentorum]
MSARSGWLRRAEAIWRGKTAPQQRLHGWLWQKTTPRAAPSEDPHLLLAIPLVSRARAPDWQMVEHNLAQTIESFRRQTDGNWRAWVCGQDRPEAVDLDPRVSFTRSSVSDQFYDKGHKRRQLIDHISRTYRGDGYYMQFDADDLLHPEFTAFVRGDHNGRGYLISEGYIVHAETGEIARLAPPERRFFRICGSSSAVYVDFRAHRRYRAFLNRHRSHTKIEKVSAHFGVTFDPVPFPAACYMIGHGQNMVERRGKMDNKIGLLDRYAVEDPAERARIRETFRIGAGA